MDESGSHAFIEAFLIIVREPDAFGVRSGWNTTSVPQRLPRPGHETVSGVGSIPADQFYLDNTYEILPPAEPKERLFLNYAGSSVADVFFKLEFEHLGGTDGLAVDAGEKDGEVLPGKFFLDTSSGEILAQPTVEGKFVGTLLAVDEAGVAVVVYKWTFNVAKNPEFGINTDNWKPDDMMKDGILGTYIEEKAYTIPGPTLTKPDLFVNEAAGDPTKVSFTLEIYDAEGSIIEPAPGKFFVENAGEMLIKPTKSGSYTAKLVGSDSGGNRAVVKEFSYIVQPPAPASDASKSTVPVISSLGGMLLLIGVVVAAISYRTYKIKMKPLDFNRMLDELLNNGVIHTEGAVELPREIKRSYLTLVEVVGKGQFGEVKDRTLFTVHLLS